MSLRERLLIRRLRDRDERAFRELVKQHGDSIFNLCYRLLGDRQDAEDVAQEVFITVFKSIDKFRGDSKLSTWIYRIASNHAKNRIKYLARRHDRKKAEYDDERRAGDSASHSPAKHVEGKQMEQIIQQAINSLDSDQRLLVVLRDIEELSYGEIAQITDLAQGTIKSRIHRARVELRKKLAQHRH